MMHTSPLISRLLTQLCRKCCCDTVKDFQFSRTGVSQLPRSPSEQMDWQVRPGGIKLLQAVEFRNARNVFNHVINMLRSCVHYHMHSV